MKYLLLLLITALVATSCGSSKPQVITTKKEQRELTEEKPIIRTKKDAEKTETVVFIEKSVEEKKASKITDGALKFEGTPYKYGGTSKKGMDCSGLVYTAFLEEDFSLPRSSRAMSLEGERLNLAEVGEGDLLFFETNKRRKVINHVGLVVGFNDEEILFIHSTTSRGVIVSNFSEAYWKNAFVMARRVL